MPINFHDLFDPEGAAEDEAHRTEELTRALARSKMPVRKPAPSPLEKRLQWIGQTLDLTKVERDVLALSVRVAHYRKLQEWLDAGWSGSRQADEMAVDLAAVLTGHSLDTIRKSLAPTASLWLLGLIEDRGGDDFAVTAYVRGLAQLPTTSERRLRERLLGKPVAPVLDWQDFGHLGGRPRPHRGDPCGSAQAKGTGHQRAGLR